MEDKKSVFIHIGYPKTGTTTLQKYLFPKHPDIVAIQSIKEPSFIKDIFTKRENSLKRNLDNIRKELNDIVSPEHSNYIYSSESLTSFSMFYRKNAYPVVETLEPNSVARKIKTVFKDSKVFDDVKIIVTLRRQDEIIKSMYAQVYNLVFKRYSNTNTFQKFLNHAIENKDSFILDAIQYHHVIEEYETLFGKDNICVLLFEEFKTKKSDYLEKLSSFMQVNTDVTLKLIGDQHTNKKSSKSVYKTDKRSITKNIFAILNKLNIKSPGVGITKTKLYSIIEAIKSPAKDLKNVTISDENHNKLNKIFSEGNEALSKKYNLNLNFYSYY